MTESTVNTSKAYAVAGLFLTVGIIFLIFSFTYLDQSSFSNAFRLSTYTSKIGNAQSIGFVRP